MFGSKKKLNLKLDSGKKANDKIAQWGVKKFDPTAKPASTNPFRQLNQLQNKINNSRDRFKSNHKGGGHRNNGRNFQNNRPPRRPENVIPENATPWAKFKDDINYQKQEEEHASQQANLNTEEAKAFLKQREINHRKLLMEEKRKEPTSWEDFEDEDSAKNNRKGGTKNKNAKNVVESTKKTEQSGIHKKKKKGHKDSHAPPPLIDEDTMKNFDASKLNLHQKNTIRQMLTKATIMRKGGVQDTLKHVREQKKKNNKKHSH